MGKEGDFVADIKYRRCYGIDNLNDPTSLRVGEDGYKLTEGTNISIGNDLFPCRRDGYSVIESGVFTRLWSQNSNMFVIKNNNLRKYYKDAGVLTSEVLWYGANDRKLVYADTGMGVYISDGIIMKVLRGGVLIDIPDTVNRLKIKTPPGNFLLFHKGRLYVVSGRYIFITDLPTEDNPYYDQVDLRTGVKPLPSNITMIKEVKTGIYVSDSYSTYFLRDMLPIVDVPFDIKMFDHAKILDYPAIYGTGRNVYKIITPSGNRYDEAVIWTSTRGICIGGNDGICENLTEKAYSMPSVVEGTDIYRKTGNLNQYITILKVRR